MATTNEPDLASLAIPTQANLYQQKNNSNQAIAKKTILKLTIMALVLMLLVSALAFTFQHLFSVTKSSAIEEFNSTRNYDMTPFDELDAQNICQLQTQEVHGKQLLTSYIDVHSSRFEPSAGVYKIFLVAHLGTRSHYEEAAIHCQINPYQHNIKHYKTVFSKNSSIMSRALKFFQK